MKEGDILSSVIFTAAGKEIFKEMNIEAGNNINGEQPYISDLQITSCYDFLKVKRPGKHYKG